MFTCIIPKSLTSSPLANVIALTDVYLYHTTSVKAITLTIGDEANDVGMIQVNIS
jgi:predicted mannosyl-3-phosphoglycerate phosphatase (HAD superfamily)